ncbi:kynureninase [Tenacibaculum finnmarkense genomovar ulcerans]|uniref:kynureninase n=1 Tax=Tenacibaculum finnmarkense TaxID=2781243 RepID=UPI0007391670|nr:kynureninase [Tenacibaculum finnmarkense]ALU75319.1 kynureninase [Tenacibaculum dicentrarchi]MBE7634794.1 kynureninase [Tenacibaculum finnmarkense genomovar ulcerans]MCD8430866.1 kynureninase [Tenacibaculum finnmarkense genomovar ulcerans]
MNYQNTLHYAEQQDKEDKLAYLRNQFHIPKDKNGKDWLYFTGNSLGLQPKQTQKYIQNELDDWAKYGVEGHFEGETPWLPYHEFLTENMAKIVGAKPLEVVVMNTLTTNLHLLMVSFYQPTKKKYKIVIESDAFPSDRYAVQSQLNFHGFDAEDGLIEWKPRKGEELLNIEDLETIIAEQGDEIALLLIGGVNYYTGQYLDLKRIAKIGHSKECFVGIDLAHGAGNISPELHDSGVDFAAWCTYKYLNSGPGSLGGLFVHEKHATNKELPRFAGWWNHNKETRFNMRQPFDVMAGAEGWQLSNPPILSMAAIKASLDMFAEVGMEALREKSEKLTGYFEFLINEINSEDIKIITPSNPKERGCQLSIQVKNADKSLHKKLTENNIITDWREPDVIRCAPTPMYNSFEDVYKMVGILKGLLSK